MSQTPIMIKEESPSSVEVLHASIASRKSIKSEKESPSLDLKHAIPHTPPKHRAVIDLCTPSPVKPNPSVKMEVSGEIPAALSKVSSNTVTSAAPIPTANQLYPTLDEAIEAVFQVEVKRGYIWRKGQSKTRQNGTIKRLTLRCRCYSTHIPSHDPRIDPSDHREGKSARCNCMAHANINHCQLTDMWRITHVDWNHSHPPQLPEGGTARARPTEEQKAIIQQFATGPRHYSRAQTADILAAQAKGPKLELRQIGSLMTAHRREAREETRALGGDFAAIIASLEAKSLDDPGWFYRILMDSTSVVTGLFWQSPTQVELGKRYGDVLINDACYGRNNIGYPLNIGIVIDGFCKSRNVFYCMQQKEDSRSVRWMLQSYLQSAGHPPTTFMSDRHATLVSVVPQVLPLTHHLYCLHHLGTNVDQQLRRILGGDWVGFLAKFYDVYRAVSPEDFDVLWNKLVDEYPQAKEYLTLELYPCRKSWAWTWTAYIFSAGVRTSGRAESENRVNKFFLGTKKAPKQAFDALNDRTNGQTVQEMERARDVSSYHCCCPF